MTHYEERLEHDIEVLRNRVTELGRTLDGALADAVRSFLERDGALAADTILRDRAVNRASRAIDRACHAFVARHLPSAGHLRFISSVLRVSTAMERIGDYAVSISREAVQSETPAPPVVVRDIEMMAEQSRAILRQAVKAFEERNVELARGTMAMESQSDTAYRKVYRDLLAEGEAHDVPVRDLFAFLVILGRLERIADQAKNLCEETVFAVTGEVKKAKSFRVLFVDERNSGASLMAAALAAKAFPGSGRYSSAGWNPAGEMDPGLAEFMDRHGHDVRALRPRQLETDHDSLRKNDVIVALAPGGREHVRRIPSGSVWLDWSAEVAAAGPVGSFEDAHREELYRRLAARIRGLMETLHGADAS